MFAVKMPKILIVGSGLTSSLTAFLVQQKFRNATDIPQLAVWDKARGEGGRMSTSRSPNNAKCIADLGAQYITCTPYYNKEHKKYYDELISAGVLEPLKETVANMKQHEVGTQHFVAPNGANTIVKYFSAKAGCQLSFNRHVADVTKCDEKWLVSTLDGHVDTFDVVVLTMPTPQVLQLRGTIADIIGANGEIKKRLEGVCYSSRYALGMFYDDATPLNLPSNISYLDTDPIFRYIAVDNLKRNRPDHPVSIVLHTSVPFGVKHVDSTPQDVEPLLLDAVRRSFPDLPQPKAVKCHKWRYSQVTTTYEGQPGVLQLSQKPQLLVGGDAFTHSNFDGCLASARKIVEALVISG